MLQEGVVNSADCFQEVKFIGGSKLLNTKLVSHTIIVMGVQTKLQWIHIKKQIQCRRLFSRQGEKKMIVGVKVNFLIGYLTFKYISVP